MAGHPSDEQLAQRAREGDAEAQTLLYRRHAGALSKRAERGLPRAVRRKVAASDVLQEAYVAAFARLDRFEDRGPGSFVLWISGIIDHKAREAVRAHTAAAKRSVRREVTRAERRATCEHAGPGASPSQEAVAKETESLLLQAMGRLPKDYRAVMRWVYEDGLTLDEVTQRLGRSRDAVRVLYGRALSRLSSLYFGEEN